MTGWNRFIKNVRKITSNFSKNFWSVCKKNALIRESHAMKRWGRYSQNMNAVTNDNLHHVNKDNTLHPLK